MIFYTTVQPEENLLQDVIRTRYCNCLDTSAEWRTVERLTCWFLPRCMTRSAMRVLCVRLPCVLLSVKRVHCDKTEERSVQIYILYERSFSLVFREEEWLVGATPST